MQEAKIESTTTKRRVTGTFVLAFLYSCSSGGTPSPDPSVTASSGDTNANGSQTGPATGGNQTGPATGGTKTDQNTSASHSGISTGSSTAAMDTGNSTAGVNPGTGTNTSNSPPGVNTGDDDSNSSTANSQTSSETAGSESQGGESHASTSGTEPDFTSDDDSGSTDPEVTVLLAGEDVDSNGPLATTVEENLSFSGGGHILVRPSNISSEPNTKHPVAIWGPGGGTPPSDYLMLLTRMASQGFVVVAIRESTGDSELMSAAIDWLEEQNADSTGPMYDRLILNRVGVFGHSMGGLSSEATALADDRVTTALLNNSGAFSHDALVNVSIPTGIIYGETGQERPNAEGDFNNPGNKGPCWLAMMAGGGHGSGPWDGAGANVAWMRWHIGGENFRKDAFIGNGGDYNDIGIWSTEFKNWDNWVNWNE